MKTPGIIAALTLAAAPVTILAAGKPAPQPSASSDAPTAPCPAMPQQMGTMQGHRMHGGGAMAHGQMQDQMQGQMQGMPMQGQMAQGHMQGHGAMMGQQQGMMAGQTGMSGGAMPCQSSPSPQPEASRKGN